MCYRYSFFRPRLSPITIKENITAERKIEAAAPASKLNPQRTNSMIIGLIKTDRSYFSERFKNQQH